MRFTIVVYLVVGIMCLSGCNELPEEHLSAYEDLPEKIDFNLHVKPILSDKCFHCHGPDQNTRKANLRLDDPENAFRLLESGNHAFVKGKPFKSRAIQRILSEDPDFRMPPPESNLSLSSEEIATLVKWLEQGAEYRPHWSFIPPESPAIPEDFPNDWKVTNEIDQFIYSKLAAKGMKPAISADKESLLRRVTLDLTGLPPTLEELDEFLKDPSSDAYEKVVDRLLNSEAHAERLAMEWLDVARYADSHGMHADGSRLMWPWRDWVISAFRRNLGYDDFVTWQIAGDLLPNATREQKLATAFNRNHPMTDEGGVVDEEFRLKYVADRAITISTAMLGMTMECASCHDHKFDPISQKEFYELSAFFNNVNEIGMIGADGNFGPMLLLTDSATDQQIAELQHYILQKEKKIEVEKNNAAVQASFELNEVANSLKPAGRFLFDSFIPSAKGRYSLDNNSRSYAKSTPVLESGIHRKAYRFGGEYDEVYLSNIGFYELYDPFSVGVWINTTKKEEGKTQTIVGNTGQKNNYWRGWDFILDENNHLSVRLVNSLPHNYLQVSSKDTIPRNEWVHVSFSYNGSGKARGVVLYINGQPVSTEVKYDRLYKSILPLKIAYNKLDPRPLMVGKSYRLHTGEFGIFKGLMDDIQIYTRELSPVEVRVMSLRPGEELSERDVSEESIAKHKLYKDSGYQAELKAVRDYRKQLLEITGPVSEVMVMEEMSTPRKTFILERGDYNSPGDPVNPSTPEAILPFSNDLPTNRLGLARWIFDPKNPLTARVTVNRYWQMIFGKGLVKTANDFGNQGAMPTHPELLDYLSVELQHSEWDLRGLLKMMVMSSVYRQTSIPSPEQMETDPENIYYARSPSYRWQAEVIRDNALAASGLLVNKVGGESVKPYQPDGLWLELSNFSKELLRYERDSGESLYRRSMYTFIRRSSPPPFMTIFDAPNRDVCTVNRERTNTPLQALVLLNDPQFVEAAKALADKSFQAGSTPNEKIGYAFRLATSRKPTSEELNVLNSLYREELDYFASKPQEAKQLLSVGEYDIHHIQNVADAAALTMVTSTILNHDAMYMKR